MNDREIKYLLTGDASKLKSELASVQKQAEQTGKSVDRALTNAFKGSADALTATFAKNLEAINKGLNNVQKGTQNAFNVQNVAAYAKQQSQLANELQKMDQQYKTLNRTADTYRQTLMRTGADAATAGQITATWADTQRAALERAGRSMGTDLGQQFGGLASVAPTLAAGIKQIDEASKESEKSTSRLSRGLEATKTELDKIHAKDFSQQSKSILDFGNSVRKSTGDISRMGLGIAAAVAAFSTIPILKTVSLIESAQLGLESLLKSTEAAGEAIYNLFTYANATPYDTSSLIAYEQKLVSVGLSGQQAFGVIQRVSDIGGAFGASSDQLDRFYYVLSQIFGAGKATGTDFLQIQNSLPGFISAIGEAMGKSAGEVRGAFGDGSVTSEVIVKALNNLTKAGGVAFQGAIKQSSTFAGIMNNLADNLKRVGMAFFGVTVTQKGMIAATEGLYARLKVLLTSILSFVENPITVKVFEAIGTAVGNLLTLLNQYPQVIAIMSGLFLAFASDLISRIPFIGNLIGEIGYGTGLVVGLFAALVASSKEVQQALAVAFGLVVQFVQQNKSLFIDLLANFQVLLQVLGQGIAPALIIATQLFLNLARAILFTINFVIQMATSIANALGPNVTRAITLFAVFIGVGLALTPVILSAAAAVRVFAVALTSTAGRLVFVIAGIAALIAVFSGLFGGKVDTSPIAGLTDIFDSIAVSTEDTAGGINDVTGALGGAGDAAKKATKQLAAFDKMNVINSPTAADAGAGGGGGGLGDLGITPPKLPDFSKLKDQLSSMLKGLEGMAPKANWWDFLIIPAAVIAGILQLIKMFAPATWDKIIAGLATFGSKFVGFFKTLPGLAMTALRSLPGMIAQLFATMGPRIAAAFNGILPAIGRAFVTIGPIILRALPGILRAVLTIGANVAKLFGPIGLAIGLALSAIIALIFNWEAVSTWFTNVFTGIVTFFTNLGTQIGEIFMLSLQGAFGPIPQIFASIVVLIVAIVATIFNILMAVPGWVMTNVITPLGAFFGNLWMGISDAFILAWSFITQIISIFANWVFVNLITPVANFFTGLWNGIVTGVTNGFNSVMAFLSPFFTWIKTKIIDPVANAFAGLWNGVVSVASGIFNRIVSVLSPIFNWIYNNVIAPISNAFNQLSSAIGQVFTNLKNTITNVFSGVLGVIKGVFNGIIDAINGVIKSINKIKVPDNIPGIGGLSPNFPTIPRLARGGVVDQATLAMFGEDGREAVMPLENNTGWIDELASKLNGQSKGSDGPTVINVYLDGNKVGGAISNSINDRTMVTGVNQIYV